ncbi:hypothetical protein P879_07524 [Paragonimus westermani]|uniref:WIF domain-containing protein n=1 Tax=Paragonimus westermani TaxID=34504 RepID=A0A8T0DLX5_9TREM|nr:hypothetical protein P879_07524 [Paragonimus westermani]
MWGDVLHWFSWKSYRIPGAVHGQLNLWVDQHMVIRILESIPLNKRSPESLRCPRPRPGMQERIPDQLFLVFNGLLLPEVLDKIALSVDKPIPPRIEELRARWKAGDERLTYSIELMSLNQTLLHKPLLNIAPSGFVPASPSDVQITLPCTGKATGIAPFRVQLDFRREFEGLRKIPPISFVVYKYCLSASKQTGHIINCECRVRCKHLHDKRRRNNHKRCIRQCQRQFNESSTSIGGVIS